MTSDAIDLLSDIPRVHGRTRGDRTALTFEGRNLTYAELDRRSDQVAGLLQAIGVKVGDRVAWLGRSSEAWYEIFFGAAKARICLAPINARLAIPEIAFILQDQGATLFFVSHEYLEVAAEVVKQVDRPITIIDVGGLDLEASGYWKQREAAPPPRLSPPQLDDDLLQLYTSGTTGLPKGVRLSNANYAALLRARPMMEGVNYGPDDSVLVLMPLFHVAGTNFSFTTMAAGGRVVLQAEFVPATVLATLEAEKITDVFLAPVMINMLLQTPGVETTDFSRLRSVSYGASPISEAVLNQAARTFGCEFYQFYGMTETTGMATALAHNEHHGALLRSCGRACPLMEIRIAGEDGAALGPGEVGEVQIRGPMVMTGYWNREEANARTLLADGWMRTGDAAYKDEDGYVFIYDRVNDMILTGGENVYPAEVENAILGCPGVADAAVIGVPDERWGEAVKAIVVATPGETPDPAAIIAWARARIAGYKTPKSVDFIDVLPRNPSGKVLRRELRKPYWEGHERQVA